MAAIQRYVNRHSFPISLPSQRGGSQMFAPGEGTTKDWFGRFLGSRQLTKETIWSDDGEDPETGQLDAREKKTGISRNLTQSGGFSKIVPLRRPTPVTIRTLRPQKAGVPSADLFGSIASKASRVSDGESVVPEGKDYSAVGNFFLCSHCGFKTVRVSSIETHISTHGKDEASGPVELKGIDKL